MKNIAILLFGILLTATSCTSEEKTIDYVFDNLTYGAVLRTISSSGEYNYYEPSTSIFKATIEEHDLENGGLMQNVEIYLSLNGGSEKVFKTIQPNEFTTGPTGLPRTDIQVSLQDAITTLGLSSNQYTGGDAVRIRLQLNLTDGRNFSSDDVTGSMTGSYFNSPYAYNMVIKCIPTKALPGIYTFVMADSYGDGWQGSRIKVTVDGKVTYYGIPSPYGSDAARNALLSDTFSGNESGGTATLTIPQGAQSMTFEWESGDWPSECSYSIVYTKLDGSSEQVAFSESAVKVGTKVLSICQ